MTPAAEGAGRASLWLRAGNPAPKATGGDRGERTRRQHRCGRPARVVGISPAQKLDWLGKIVLGTPGGAAYAQNCA